MWLYSGQDLSYEYFTQTPHALNYLSVQQLSRYQLPALQIPQIPTQHCLDLSCHSVPISASPARSTKGFLTVLPRQIRSHSAHTSMESILIKMSIWHSEHGITEIPVKQFMYFG